MFKSKNLHHCQLQEDDSESFLPHLPTNATCFARFARAFKKAILASPDNPQSAKFLISSTAILDERRRQAESGSWIIHPFSIFRLYYEMWMLVVFFVALLLLPLKAAFIESLEHGWDNTVVCCCCWIDILLTFRTGYCATYYEVEMRSGKIAKHYIFGVYFITDVLSSLPGAPLLPHVFRKVFYYLGVLKIVRCGTLWCYLKQTLEVRRMYISLAVFITLLLHITACLRKFLPKLSEYLKLTANTTQYNSTNIHNFVEEYFYHLYGASSYILGVDRKYVTGLPWISYAFAIVVFIVGKFLVCFVTVVLIEAYILGNCLENKYYAMLSQVQAFMSAYKFPESLQKRVQQYYSYKYKNKYLNESRINKYISEKLKKEIKYHYCRLMVQSVSFFQLLPKEIVEDIVTYLKQELYLPGDIIIKCGIQINCMYFLSSGTVAVSSSSGKEICHLKDGEYFGEISLLLPGQKTTANITALETCEVYKLESKKFKEIFENNNELYIEIKRAAIARLNQIK